MFPPNQNITRRAIVTDQEKHIVGGWRKGYVHNDRLFGRNPVHHCHQFATATHHNRTQHFTATKHLHLHRNWWKTILECRHRSCSPRLFSTEEKKNELENSVVSINGKNNTHHNRSNLSHPQNTYRTTISWTALAACRRGCCPKIPKIQCPHPPPWHWCTQCPACFPFHRHRRTCLVH